MRITYDSIRIRFAVRISLWVSFLLKWLGLGEGATLPGRILLGIAPNAINELSEGLCVILVSGTNAKTTTTALAKAGLQARYSVVSNVTGANMREGIAFSLAQRSSRHSRDEIGLFEVDESYLPSVGQALSPKVIALLNLSRDQLDRVSETRMTSIKWRNYLAGSPDISVVANCDDPLIVYSAEKASDVIWVAAGLNFKFDARSCPNCGAEIRFSADDWLCDCGLRRPDPRISLVRNLVEIDGRRIELDMQLPGRCNVANAAVALGVCLQVGVDLEDAAAQMSKVDEVAGRYRRISITGHQVRMLLTKNQAGWLEVFDMIGTDKSVVVGINSRIADGKDPSWLWDVPFEMLKGKEVIASGERAYDLSVRLRYAGIDHRLAKDPLEAIELCSHAEVSFVGNYTSFQDLRRKIEGNDTKFLPQLRQLVGRFSK